MENEEMLVRIAFIGETLSPFYLEDPKQGEAGPLYVAMAGLDVDSAAAEWPFAPQEEAKRCLALMNEGAAPSVREGAFKAEDALLWEWRRLFIGPDIKPAPPWGSVYTDREMVVFGESTLALRSWMRRNGVARLSDERTPEDHIGLMLALMAWLARNKSECLDEYLRDHFFTWSSHFLGELAEATEHPFFRGLAGLTKASLEGIQRARGITVEYPRYYR